MFLFRDVQEIAFFIVAPAATSRRLGGGGRRRALSYVLPASLLLPLAYPQPASPKVFPEKVGTTRQPAGHHAHVHSAGMCRGPGQASLPACAAEATRRQLTSSG